MVIWSPATLGSAHPPDRPPRSERSEHPLAARPLGRGVGDDLQPATLRGEQALGSVDILPKREGSSDEMNENERAPGAFGEAAEDIPEVPNRTEQTLDPRSLAIEAHPAPAAAGAARLGWDVPGTAPFSVMLAVMVSLSSARSARIASTAGIETVPGKGMAARASPAQPEASTQRSGLPRLSARPRSSLESSPRERPSH